jgi:hypothetical protein
LLCWFTRGLFLCLIPFLWGKGSDLSVGPLQSACCDGLLIIFQFCNVVLLWMLLTGLGDELCGLLPALFQVAAYHLPLLALLPFQPLFTESSCRDQLLAPPTSPMCLQHPTPLPCVSF